MTVSKRTALLCLFSALFLLPSTRAKAMEPVEIYREKSPSVVLIFAKLDENTRNGGTGFFISERGLVVTNAHVVCGPDSQPLSEITVFLKPSKVTGDFQEDLKDKHPARVIKYDRALDIAVLEVEELSRKIPSIGFADSDEVEVGQKVVAIGHPEQGGLWTLTSGAISTRIKNISHVQGKDMFQSDASINHGNSGGPLLDSNGMLIGMNSSTVRKSADGSAIVGINFALQSNVISKWLSGQGIKAGVPPASASAKPHAAPKESEKEAPPVPTKVEIVTPEKPFKWTDLEATIAELEGMMDEMRGKVKEKFGE